MYERHTTRFMEPLDGTVGSLGRYVDLAKKGGHLDELRKPTSVMAALWGLKRVFAYVRLMARQQHQHREAEDDIVRKLIKLLPKFDILSMVRDAVCITEQLASDGDGQRVPSALRLRGGPVERPAIQGCPAYDRRRVPLLVGSARPSVRSCGVPQDFDDVRIYVTGVVGQVFATMTQTCQYLFVTTSSASMFDRRANAGTITATRLRKAHIA